MIDRISASALLLSVALVMSGCNSVPQPQAQSTQTRPAGSDEYNRTYGTETHHHHRHGKGGEASGDGWSGYDRTDTADDRSGRPNANAYARQQDDSQRADGAPGRRSIRHHNSRALTAAPGQFDFYVLNLSWSPEFCGGHPSAAECTQHRAFTLHGLWPQNNNGTYPEDCSEAAGPANPSQYADIYPDASLLQHEWQTHGTCSGLAADAFFTLARRAEQSITIPPALSHLTQATSLPPAQIITLFTQANRSIPAAGVAISCGSNSLTAVEVCLNKDLKPESCSAVKTCGATQVRVPAPR